TCPAGEANRGENQRRLHRLALKLPFECAESSKETRAPALLHAGLRLALQTSKPREVSICAIGDVEELVLKEARSELVRLQLGDRLHATCEVLGSQFGKRSKAENTVVVKKVLQLRQCSRRNERACHGIAGGKL